MPVELLSGWLRRWVLDRQGGCVCERERERDAYGTPQWMAPEVGGCERGRVYEREGGYVGEGESEKDTEGACERERERERDLWNSSVDGLGGVREIERKGERERER